MILRDLVFTFDNLRYDVDNLAYIIGRRVSDDDPLRQRITDITQENNLDRVKRRFDLAYAEVNEFCYPYTKRPVESRTGTDVNNISDKAQYVVSLHLPCDIAKSTLEVLREHINEYFIWMAMTDWLKLTAPELGKVYEDKLSDIETEIRSDVTARFRMTTIRPSVF